MYYLYDKFCDCTFSRLGFIVWTNTHTDADDRLILATVVSVSNRPNNDDDAISFKPMFYYETV